MYQAEALSYVFQPNARAGAVIRALLEISSETGRSDVAKWQRS